MKSPAVAFSALLAGCLPSLAVPQEIPPEAVVVVYNSNLAESRELARHYTQARAIPSDNLVGLPFPDTDEISRADFDEAIRAPLARTFDRNKWWKRGEGPGGLTQPISNQKKVLVLVRGVPFKIARTPDTIPEGAREKRPFAANVKGNEASVDSELTLLGVEDYPLEGPMNNPYFRMEESVMSPKVPSFLIVGRIDGPSPAICRRMVNHAIKVEKEGLWGMAYLDLAKKGAGYEAGDTWLENIAKANRSAGIPTVIDRHRDTLVTNYPMREAAVYYGWYAHSRNGPLLDEEFEFRDGAVAVHLHSFSAFELRNPQRRWAGPILAKGAAATLGNVYEPFLHLTHHFDIFHQRLLDGYSIGEAAQMSIPALSWQGLLLGDPLYRPFPQGKTIDLSEREDREFKVIRSGFQQWGDDPETLVTKLRTAANRLNSGAIFETMGLLAREDGKDEQALAFFKSAGDKYLHRGDKLRQELHIVDVYRTAGNKEAAVALLRQAEPDYSKLPGEKALTALINILDPPAPPPVKVNPKGTRNKK